MLWVGLLAQAVVFSILSGVVAQGKNRSVPGWVLIGFLFGFFGFIASVAVGEVKPEKEKASDGRGSGRVGSENREFDPDQHEKKCPACAEYIKLEARVCRYCGHEFPEEEVEKQIEEARKEFEENREAKVVNRENASSGSGAPGDVEGSGAAVVMAIIVIAITGSVIFIALLSP